MDRANRRIFYFIKKSKIPLETLLIFLFLIGGVNKNWGQTAGDYRSATSGNWNAIATWEKFDGVSWNPAAASPTNADGVITIRSPHVVTISASGLTYDQVVVNAGGQVTVAPTITSILANGTGTDLTINGTWLNQGGTWTVTGTSWTVGSGGTYIHNTTSSAATPLGQATFDAASMMIFRGSSSLTPAVSLAGRTFGNLTFESTSGSWSVTATGGTVLTVNGDFLLGASVTITNQMSGANIFAGNYTINGTMTNSTNTQSYTFTGSGKTISGSSAISFEIFNVNSSASITATSAFTIASTFTGTVTGTLVTAATFTNSGTLNVDGTFQLNQGGSLSGTSAVYGSASTLIYAGTSSQTPTATEFPSSNGPNNLTINNSAGVTLPFARTINGTLILTSGKLTLGANNITVGTIIGNSSNYVFTDGMGKLIMTPPASPTATTFPIGASASSYDPVTVKPTNSVPFAINVKETTGPGDFTGTDVDYANVVHRLWDITPTDSAGDTEISLTNGGAVYTPTTPVIGHYNGISWIEIPASYASNTWTGITSGFSPFGAGSVGALPLRWLQFKANLYEELKSKLDWITADEINNSHFEIQRSNDNGRNFNNIGKVNAASGDQPVNSYQFIDRKAMIGKNYYRLKQVDFDGKYDFSPIRTVTFSSGAFSVKAWPNPASSKVIISINHAGEAGKIILIDITGKQVLYRDFESGASDHELVGEDLQPGMYTLVVISGDNRYVEKIVVMY